MRTEWCARSDAAFNWGKSNETSSSLETLITIIIAVLLVAGTVFPYYRKFRRREAEAHQRWGDLKLTGLDKAGGVHPHIDVLACIGCGGCVDACPEGDVLGVVDGKAILVHGAKCVGHGRCADACPVGAIRLVLAPPGRGAELPILSEQFETNMPGIFVAGELGGLGLIRNAVAQGVSVVRSVASRPNRAPEGVFDVVIVGAGPAGLASGLAAQERGLRYLVLEQETIGGAILHYPRRKIVLTSPFELPLWGTVKFTEVSKEDLLVLWERVLDRTGLAVRTSEKVNAIVAGHYGYEVRTPSGVYPTSAVVLAVGRRGTPRKLGVPGEEQAKVMYRLIDAGTYVDCDVLIVGGGDSAIEAAIGLSMRMKNRVTISYRGESFTRIKERNNRAIAEAIRRNHVRVYYSSTVREIEANSVALDTAEGLMSVKNDIVFIFAGGETPFDFLRSVGVGFQTTIA